jgi:hypothetical protein
MPRDSGGYRARPLKKHLIICFFIWLISKRWLLFVRFRYRRTLSAGNASASSFAKPCSLWGLQLLLFPLESPPFTPSSYKQSMPKKSTFKKVLQIFDKRYREHFLTVPFVNFNMILMKRLISAFPGAFVEPPRRIAIPSSSSLTSK